MGASPRVKMAKLQKAVQYATKDAPFVPPMSIPHELKPHAHRFPLLPHNKRTTFWDDVTETGKNRVRHVAFPNMVVKPLYSRALDQMIWFKASTEAIRQVDRVGGLDEYLVSVSDDYICGDKARYWRQRVREALAASGPPPIAAETAMSAKYGQDYVDRLKKTVAAFHAKAMARMHAESSR